MRALIINDLAFGRFFKILNYIFVAGKVDQKVYAVKKDAKCFQVCCQMQQGT
jgi:hypothetical protein